jgi:transposase
MTRCHHVYVNAYSEDLRKKIVEALSRGMGKSEAAHTFSVSLSSVKRYAKTVEEGHSLAPKKRPGSQPKMGEDARRLLEADLEERPAATLAERRDVPGEGVRGQGERLDGLSRLLKRMGFTRKKGCGCERARGVPEGRLADAGRRGPRGWALRVRGRDGANTSRAPLYAWSRQGERARCIRRRATAGRTRRCWRA